MERRRETRFEPNQPVSVVLLSEGDLVLPARIINMSGRGVSLATQRPLKLGAAVRINLEDSLLLGEVCHIRQDGGSWIFGIKLDQVIPSVSEVARLVSAIMGTTTPAAARAAAK